MGERSKTVPYTGATNAAFRHYSRGFPGGKPAYRLTLKEEERSLYGPQRLEHWKVNSNCQMCYNLSQYIKLWGSDKCTNHFPFDYSIRLLKKYFPHGVPKFRWYNGDAAS